jgi:hypothetical protein
MQYTTALAIPVNTKQQTHIRTSEYISSEVTTVRKYTLDKQPAASMSDTKNTMWT